MPRTVNIALSSTQRSHAGYSDDEIFTLDFQPLKGQGLIQEDVKALKQKIDEITKGKPGAKVDIIAYSRGGLIAELYTMMFGSQYQSTMKYSYIDADGNPQEPTITNIPRYGHDINQIIMMETPQKGAGVCNFFRNLPIKEKWKSDLATRFNQVDPTLVGNEQLQDSGSNFMEELFWKNALNSNVTYINIAGAGGIVGFDSAQGVPLHQELKTLDKVLTLTSHADFYKDTKVKKRILQNLFNKNPITAQISISPESPVREGAISISITLSESLPSAPTLFIKGNGAFSSPHPISLAGSGKNFSVILNIPKGTDGSAKLYFEDKTQMQVKIASADCNEEIIETIDVPISGYQFFLIDTEEPEVTATTPANGEVIIAEDTPYTVNISATLFDPPINGYASGIDPTTIVLNTPQGTFHQASAVNKLDYGEYSCSIEAKDNANTPGHDLKVSPYRWSFEIVPAIFVKIHPTWQNFTNPNESHTHYITITNKSKKKSFTANIEMKLIKESGCLSITQYPAATLEIPADSQASTSFVV
ncbi:MAG: Ig-like domain-containing protein, partial [bacterium]